MPNILFNADQTRDQRINCKLENSSRLDAGTLSPLDTKGIDDMLKICFEKHLFLLTSTCIELRSSNFDLLVFMIKILGLRITNKTFSRYKILGIGRHGNRFIYFCPSTWETQPNIYLSSEGLLRIQKNFRNENKW